MLIGYARVSTHDQNVSLQVEALTHAGCQRIFDDKLSGNRAERPGLTKALDMLREGDTLVVWNPWEKSPLKLRFLNNSSSSRLLHK